MGSELVFIYFFALAFTFFLSCFFTHLIRQAALKKGWITKPNHRTIHNGSIPFGGGISIYLAFLVSVILISFLLRQNQKMAASLPIFINLLIPATFIFILGLIDDLVELRSRYKLIVEIVAGVLLFASGIKIPLSDIINNPLVEYFISLFLTISWVVLVTNAINLIDGVDGLAGGITAIASIFLFFFTTLFLNISVISILYLVLAGSIIGFLVYNFPPAKIFMGDSGSLFIGFLLSAITIISCQKTISACPFIITAILLAIPLTDTGWAIIRRLKKHQGLFHADKEHIHHSFLKAGFSQKKRL
jgi:UDP-GlcNAc:undecaprenyl-phosphate/decaprenyl-phosphate GlcNAc-1-phosphate transferase